MPARARRRPALAGPLFLLALLALEALSLEAVAGWLVMGTAFLALIVVVGAFLLLFPGSQFFTLALSASIGVYTCIFVFFVEARFSGLAPSILAVGLVLPLVAFLGGALLRRREIHTVVLEDTPLTVDAKFGRAFVWLVIVAAIGITVLLLPAHWPIGPAELFLAAMVSVALVVLLASHDVAVMLLDSGLLFEEFFEQATKLLEPAFAFFSFYSLLVIAYASLFTVLDRFSGVRQFVIEGESRPIRFAESLYFSVITLSTVGYGDILPRTDFVRMVVASEVVVGVIMLLFGFNAIFSYSSDHRRRRRGSDRSAE